jgi:hypothetical protein
MQENSVRGAMGDRPRHCAIAQARVLLVSMNWLELLLTRIGAVTAAGPVGGSSVTQFSVVKMNLQPTFKGEGSTCNR